jgi:aryl-alcohol dehydrogenase-like predicted oxidoreductase
VTISWESPPTATDRLALGLAALGRPGYLTLQHGLDLAGVSDPDGLQRRCHALLDAAWAAGIRAFDTARSYGRAEAFLAAWLERREIPPGSAFVSSKWGYVYTAGWRVDAAVHEAKEHSDERLRRQWPESRALLGAHLRLYQIHSYTPDSPALDDPMLLRTLASLREQGVSLGASVSGAQQNVAIERLIALELDGVRLFDAVQATWNLLEPSAEGALAAAHAAGMTVIVKEALANGRLTDRGVESGPLADAAARAGVGIDAVALAAALARPWATRVLLGACTLAQLASNLTALSVAWEEATGVGLAEPAAAYWQQRSALPWT